MAHKTVWLWDYLYLMLTQFLAGSSPVTHWRKFRIFTLWSAFLLPCTLSSCGTPRSDQHREDIIPSFHHFLLNCCPRSQQAPPKIWMTNHRLPSVIYWVSLSKPGQYSTPMLWKGYFNCLDRWKREIGRYLSNKVSTLFTNKSKVSVGNGVVFTEKLLAGKS